MAYYRVYRCPHCKNFIRRLSGPLLLGAPFKKCEKCGQDYVDTSTEEWVSKSMYAKWSYVSSKPAGITCLVALAIFVICLICKLNSYIAGGLFFLFVFTLNPIFSIFSFIKMKGRILESLERTTDPKYVEALKKADFKICIVKDFELKLILPKGSNIEEFKQKLKLAGVKVQGAAETENMEQCATADVTNNTNEQVHIDNNSDIDTQLIDEPIVEDSVFEEFVAATEIVDEQIQDKTAEDEDELIDID